MGYATTHRGTDLNYLYPFSTEEQGKKQLMESSPAEPEQGLRWVFKKAYSLSLYLVSCFKEFWLVFARAYDYLSRDFKRISLEEVLKKQQLAVAEKMLSAGVGDDETRKLLLEKTKALTQAVANQATSKEKKALEEDRWNLIEKFLSNSINALPSSDHTVLEFQKAKQSLDYFEKSVALASSSQTPIKKGKAAIGFLIAFLALGFLAGEKKDQGGTSNETNKEKVATESRANKQNGVDIGNVSSKKPKGMNPYYKRGFDIGYGQMGNGQRSSALPPFPLPREVLIAIENRFRDELFKLEMDMLTAKREFDQFKSPQHEAVYQEKRGMFEGYQKGAQDCGFKL